MSEPSSTITLSHSLATDPRTHLEAWLEDVETQARHLCPQWDLTGALTLVVPDNVWEFNPCNIVPGVSGATPTVRARPTWDMPAQHANNAAAAVVSIYREEATKHRDFSKASSALTTALLIGERGRSQSNPPSNGFSHAEALHAHSAPSGRHHVPQAWCRL